MYSLPRTNKIAIIRLKLSIRALKVLTCLVFLDDIHGIARMKVDLMGVLSLVVTDHTILF